MALGLGVLKPLYLLAFFYADITGDEIVTVRFLGNSVQTERRPLCLGSLEIDEHHTHSLSQQCTWLWNVMLMWLPLPGGS